LVTILILVVLTYFFVFDFLLRKTQSVLFTNLNKAYVFQFIGVCYMNCFLLAMWALARTYMVGPGFTTDHFKSVKFEYLDLLQLENPGETEDCRDD